MCTSIDLTTKYHYFGRNLDLEYSYDESVTVTPRNYSFNFTNGECIGHHYAMIGMAYVKDGYPLYYDAVNEMGLCAAGLSFPGNARYHHAIVGKTNIAPYEFIPYILSKFRSTEVVRAALADINICDIPFCAELPNTPLHWHISDKHGCLCVEPCRDGLKIYDNPVGILTNNPEFDIQLFNLNNYLNVTAKEAKSRFSDKLFLCDYSRGMGAVGLPGDWSSQSRFVRAAFLKYNSTASDSERESVSRFFHIADSVSMVKGCVIAGGRPEYTVYSSCCNADKGIYYYKTYNSCKINAVVMKKRRLFGSELEIHGIRNK